MTKMTRLLPLLALALMTLVSIGLRPVTAQSRSFAPVVTVNGMGITAYDIDQRQRFMQLLDASGTSRKDAEEALIQDRLRIWAAKQIDLTIDDAALQRGMAEFAGRANISAEKFVATLQQNGVDPATFREFVRAGMLWREVVRARFGPQVNITKSDIDRAMMPESQVGKGVRVLISEAIMPAPPGREDAAMSEARQLSAARGQAAFGALASQYSASQSRAQGGRVDWMPLSNLPAPLRAKILALKPGTATAPIQLQGAVAVFMLRAIGDGAPDRGPLSLSYMTFNLGPAGSEQAQRLASKVAANARRCDELYTIAKGMPASALVAHDNVAQSQIPTDIGVTLAHLDIGETEVMQRGGAAQLVMLCDRTETPQGDATAPSRDAVRSQLENSALSSYAQGYLADLEADAIIVRK
ncbi:peptidyl-prolyl cis-trans isomerase SurA [Thioclava dalianensis]|nr:SurA N-terminal domain-containing protein [Thioclava dalianensis]SFN58025.1 peptidyl-prolyl cis-trans isomerase SurA [Thioclava dalianensis]